MSKTLYTFTEKQLIADALIAKQQIGKCKEDDQGRAH
jgi:hypothetical protein